MSQRKRSPKKPDPNLVPRDPTAPPIQPLMTTLRETRSMARAVSNAEILRTPIEIEEYRQKNLAPPVDGNTALQPDPVDEVEPTPRTASPTPAVWAFEVPSASPSAKPAEEAKAPDNWIEKIRTLANANPKIAAIVLAAVSLITAGIYFMTRTEKTTSLAFVREQAASLDGQTVTVEGKIGEVYQMGSSYAYLLHQGRDTVVIYTRTSHPIPGERVVISGSVSTGFLDGVPRVAIFQNSAK